MFVRYGFDRRTDRSPGNQTLGVPRYGSLPNSSPLQLWMLLMERALMRPAAVDPPLGLRDSVCRGQKDDERTPSRANVPKQ